MVKKYEYREEAFLKPQGFLKKLKSVLGLNVEMESPFIYKKVRVRKMRRKKKLKFSKFEVNQLMMDLGLPDVKVRTQMTRKELKDFLYEVGFDNREIKGIMREY